MLALGHADEAEWRGLLTVMYESTEKDLLAIKWPAEMEKPTLDCGQHRCAALAQVLEAQNKEAKKLADEGKPNVPVTPKVRINEFVETNLS